ncbi:MAG: hypothetical protein ABIE94_05130 [archaeon]
MKMKKRGAYFFVIDVFVASSIVILALILIFNFFLKKPEIEQPRLYADDFMGFLLTTEVREFQNDYKWNLTQNGTITNTHQSLFDQIMEFHNNSRDRIAFKFIHNMTKGLIPNHLGIEYTINNESIYNRSLTTRNTSSFLLSSKKIGFLRTNRTKLYGPVVCEVQIWD